MSKCACVWSRRRCVEQQQQQQQAARVAVVRMSVTREHQVLTTTIAPTPTHNVRSTNFFLVLSAAICTWKLYAEADTSVMPIK